jgi:hypothetical protein
MTQRVLRCAEISFQEFNQDVNLDVNDGIIKMSSNTKYD